MQLALVFPVCFWDEKADMFGIVAPTERERGKFFLFLNLSSIAKVIILPTFPIS